MVTAGIYARLSVSRDASASIERQLSDCRSYATDRGWRVAFELADDGVSATRSRLDRPALDEVRRRWSEIDHLLVWDADRLARSTLDTLTLLAEAAEHAVSVVTPKGDFGVETAAGRLMTTLKAGVAEHEAAQTSARVKASNRLLRTAGRVTGGNLPFQLRKVALPTGGFGEELDPDRAEVVREVVGRVLDREPILRIARDLTARGVPTRRGADVWGPTALRSILRSRSLIGRTTFKGEDVRGPDGAPVAVRPALIDALTWTRLQAELDRRRPQAERHFDSAALLAGLARCGECGSAMYSRTQLDRGGTVRPSYACGAFSAGRSGCPGVLVSAPRLDDHVESVFLAQAGRLPVTRLVEVPGADRSAEIADVRLRLADLREERHLRGGFREPGGLEAYEALAGRLAAEVTRLEAEHQEPEQRWEETGQRFSDAYEAADTTGRRALLASALVAVDVMKGRPREPFDAGRVDVIWKQ